MNTLTKGIYGRRGLPVETKQAMMADYYRLRSLAQVAALYGRTRQAMWEILTTAGCRFYKKNPLASIVYKGRKFTPGKGGYYRDTAIRSTKPNGFEVQLHRQIWVDHNGAIPAGYQVGIKDGNKANCAVENLMCLPLSEIVRLKATGANGHTKSAKARLQVLVKTFANGEVTLAQQLKSA